MSHRPPARRSLRISFNALALSGSIALGLWLGFLAIALTCWLASHFLLAPQIAPVAQAVQRLTQPAAVAPEPQNRMFEQYQENLRKNEELQSMDNARSNPRNLSNPKCQFWLQQDQTAPSEKSRANVLQFCN
ncbi:MULTISPECIES: hypothetical protein [unclassified Pseudomonas]|uniref:hypothetical protein n=1 Tax=unclassified Pseudomonas TaxID=196821 RepID=UPI000839AC0C|nr:MULTISPECIES: hypothetical protein [unclassified Pseudomonas]QIH09944.1 hypothetical protein ATY02_26120 [Pseudomonas sp. BIOMIG1BAC]UMZ10206.1 hypothetical protein I9018_22285 [Pseudomonas sp. MPFS]